MKTSVYRFSLDVNQSQSQVSISAGKGENGVRLIIRMTENGAPFEVEDGSYAVFSAVKPDGKPVINDCAIFGNDTVVYDFTEQTVAVEGITRCQILLFGPDRSLIASARFQIVVHETIWDKGIESAEEFNVVKKFVEDINTVNDRLDKNASDIVALDERVTANADEIADNAERIETNADNHLQLLDRLYGEDGDVPDIRATLTEHGGQIENLMGDVADNRDGLAEVRSDLANFLDVDDHTRDQLSEVLSLITANEQAIKQFVSMGGAPVGSGTLVVPASEWSDGSPTTAFVDLPANTMHAGSVMLLTPANDATKEAASKARLSMSVDASGDYGDEVNDVLLLLRAETAYKPEADMEFAFVILQTTAETSLVTLIGVDAAGDPEPTEVDLSGFEDDGTGKGVIKETYADGTVRETEVVYDGAGNIIKIGEMAIKWGGEA